MNPKDVSFESKQTPVKISDYMINLITLPIGYATADIYYVNQHIYYAFCSNYWIKETIP
jgi:hypothetical protein